MNEPPTEMRLTPSAASPGTSGPRGLRMMLTGRSVAPTTALMSSALVSPGTMTTSAPASA